jgi:two-component system OmpR family sensor kinase
MFLRLRSGIVGTGVGLYLVKMVVDLHRGDVAVESREGEGARFTVRLPSNLPAKTASPAPLAPAAAQPHGSESIERRAAAK